MVDAVPVLVLTTVSVTVPVLCISRLDCCWTAGSCSCLRLTADEHVHNSLSPEQAAEVDVPQSASSVELSVGALMTTSFVSVVVTSIVDVAPSTEALTEA